VTQEALRNARVHGQPARVEVRVSADAHRAALTVVDDGCGFDMAGLEDWTRPGHFGLRLMRDLADHAGGELDVQSSPGHGTTVRLDVPLT
jgi:two-component system NarL family sensor kinase